MEIDWITVPEFESYMVSNYGEILNKGTGRLVRQSLTSDGAVKVGLYNGRFQQTRLIKLLVANAFVVGRDDIFDTPINLDGNKENNRADNLVWRPRWFAIAYTKQFHQVSENDRLGPLWDTKNGDRYFDVYEAAVLNGLLFKDIRKSVVTGESVFPTFQTFKFI